MKSASPVSGDDMLDAFLSENHRFRPFSIDHFLALLTGAVFFTVLIVWARKQTPRRQVQVGAVLAYAILVAYLTVFILVDIIQSGGFNPKKHLPLAMCNVCGISIWLFLHRKNYLAYEILFFWIMSGTVAACLTPDIKHTFPHYTFLAFWTIHLGLVGGALYATFVYGMRPGLGSLIKSFLLLHVYAGLVGLLNWLLRDYDANYFYLCHKPEVWTPLNWFGPWPYYLFGGQLIGAVVFAAIYLPFAIMDLVRHGTLIRKPRSGDPQADAEGRDER